MLSQSLYLNLIESTNIIRVFLEIIKTKKQKAYK